MDASLRNAIRAGLVTAGVTFAVLFAGSLTGWLQDVAAWAQAGPGEVVMFPDPGVLGKAAVAALVAAAIGLVNTIIRALQATFGFGKPPVYEVPVNPAGGDGDGGRPGSGPGGARDPP